MKKKRDPIHLKLRDPLSRIYKDFKGCRLRKHIILKYIKQKASNMFACFSVA